MKNLLFILSIILFIASCTAKISTAKNTTDDFVNEMQQPFVDGKTNNIITAEIVPLLIGGKIITEDGKPLKNTIDEINNIYSLYLIIDPLDPERRSSLENLELLRNLKDITIRGKNLDKVDFSPISSLLNLEELEITGDITRLPDMTRLKQLKKIKIDYDYPIFPKLESLKGIGAPNVKDIYICTGKGNIDSLAPLNNLQMLESLTLLCESDKVMKISDITNMPNLKSFEYHGGKIDMCGIDFISSLEKLDISDCGPINLDGIGRLNKLELLHINLLSNNTSIDFLKNMYSLKYFFIIGHYGKSYWQTKNNFDPPSKTEILQIIDITPLTTIKTLDTLIFENLVIKNISSLDVFNDRMEIWLENSRLYDDNDKTKHWLRSSLELDN